MDTAASKLVTQMQANRTQRLASTAAKKNSEPSKDLPKGVSTRTKSKLQPIDPTAKTFTIANVKKAKNKLELLFQMQECATLFGAQFQRLNMEMEEKATCVAHFLKEFQRQSIYASCDSLIYHRVGNTVRFTV